MQQRITIIDGLRGLASFSVLLFHLIKNLPGIDPHKGLISAHIYGKLGVQVFFVISGFVIIYSLNLKQYKIQNFFTFLKKRIIRLDPVYFAVILLVLVIASTKVLLFPSRPFEYTFLQIIGHIGYLNGFLKEEWMVPVFWTLAIEFQFYVVIALVFPMIEKNMQARVIFLIAFLISSFFFELSSNSSSKIFVFQHAGLFACGILACWYQLKKINLITYINLLAISFTQVYYSFGPSELIACILPVGIITLIPYFKPHTTIDYLGNISYSLYLIHQVVGYPVMRMTYKFLTKFDLNHFSSLVSFLCAVAASILSAHLLWKYIEQPTQKISSQIKYE